MDLMQNTKASFRIILHGSSYIYGLFIFILLLAAIPLIAGPFKVLQLTQFLILGLLALSLDLIWGYAGIMSFGQRIFFGLGAYAYGVVAINTVDVLGHTNWAVLAGVLLPFVFAVFLGYFTFYGRVSDVYFAIITLAVTLIMLQLMGSTAGSQYKLGKALLGGYNGMTGIPGIRIVVPGFDAVELDITKLYYFVCFLLVAIYVSLRALLNSYFGRIVISIRENEERTSSFGYDTRFYKLAVFSISGALAGLSGVLFAAWGNFINPEVFGLVPSALVIIWVLVGGRGTLIGAIIGTVAVEYATATLGGIFLYQTSLVVGIALVAVVLLFPQGLAPNVIQFIERWFPGNRGRNVA
jgi:ABC-type branched-subunit amino acid transport system permease subunit